MCISHTARLLQNRSSCFLMQPSPCICTCACVLTRFGHVRLSATPWTVDHQALSLSIYIYMHWIVLWFFFSNRSTNENYWRPESFPKLTASLRCWKWFCFVYYFLFVYHLWTLLKFISSCSAAAAAAQSLQSCPALRDPIDSAHQAPPSLGFSRQEHWCGLPFPSPMHESEKRK